MIKETLPHTALLFYHFIIILLFFLYIIFSRNVPIKRCVLAIQNFKTAFVCNVFGQPKNIFSLGLIFFRMSKRHLQKLYYKCHMSSPNLYKCIRSSPVNKSSPRIPKMFDILCTNPALILAEPVSVLVSDVQ